jgi:DNA repair exonuclease SbcCD ATPase subunit
MVERQTKGARRKRRSSATLERLEAARRRRVEQLERERENEARVDAALGPFAEAATAIEAVERRRENRVAALRAQLERRLAELDRQRAARVAEFERLAEQVRADAEMEIGEWRSVMATSVAQIRAADVGAAETAALLGISAKTVTALSRYAAAATAATSDSNGHPGEAEEPAAVAGDPLATADDREAEASADRLAPQLDGRTDVTAE